MIELDGAKVSEKTIRMDKLRGRLLDVTNRLIQQVPTPLRMVLEKYYPHMRMGMAHNGASAFPQSMARQIRNAERTSKLGFKGDVLCFHIANAILSYYEQNEELMEKRVALLESFAAAPYAKCQIDGDVKTGYCLSAPLTAPENKKKSNVPAPAKK